MYNTIKYYLMQTGFQFSLMILFCLHQAIMLNFSLLYHSKIKEYKLGLNKITNLHILMYLEWPMYQYHTGMRKDTWSLILQPC